MIGQMHTGIRLLVIGLLVIVPAAYGFGSHDYSYERNRDLAILLAASQYHSGYTVTVSCAPSTIQISGQNIQVNTVNTVVHQLSNGTWVCTSEKPIQQEQGIIITSNSTNYRISSESPIGGGFTANTTFTNTTHYDTGLTTTYYNDQYQQPSFNQTQAHQQVIESMTTQSFTTSPFNQVISSFVADFNSTIFKIIVPGVLGIIIIWFITRLIFGSTYTHSKYTDDTESLIPKPIKEIESNKPTNTTKHYKTNVSDS